MIRIISFLTLISIFIIPKGGAFGMQWWILLTSLSFFAYSPNIINSKCSASKIIYIIACAFLCGILLNLYTKYYNDKFFSSLLINILLIPSYAVMLGLYLRKGRSLFQKKINYTISIFITITAVVAIFSFAFTNLYYYFPTIGFINTIGFTENDILDKCNNRGFLFKAFGLYNNGNILGLSMVLGLPFVALSIGRSCLYIVVAAIILSLSRTAWIGLVYISMLFCIRYVLYMSKNNSNKCLVYLALISISFLIIATRNITLNNEYLTNFMEVDRSLGGRILNWNDINIMLFPSLTFKPVCEMTYLSFFQNFGIILGFLLVVWLLVPLFINIHNNNYSIKKCLFDARFISGSSYLLMSTIDGCFHFYPPIIYYFIIMFSLPNSQKQLLLNKV